MMMKRKNNPKRKIFGVSLLVAVFLFSTVGAQAQSEPYAKSPRTAPEYRAFTLNKVIRTLKNSLIPSAGSEEQTRSLERQVARLEHRAERAAKRLERRKASNILDGMTANIRNMAQSAQESSLLLQRLVAAIAPAISTDALNVRNLSLSLVTPSTPQRLHSLQILRL